MVQQLCRNRAVNKFLHLKKKKQTKKKQKNKKNKERKIDRKRHNKI